MNYFGHLAIARRRCDEVDFVLGAMLPDLCGMAGVHATADFGERLRPGIDFHHRTDARFHDGAAFQELLRQASAELGGRGLPRWSAHAAAHVAIELCLDATFLGETGSRARFADAAGALAAGAYDDAIEVPAQRTRLLTVVRRMQDHGAPGGYDDPAVVARITVGALSRRPRLRLGDDAAAALHGYAPVLAALVARRSDDLIAPTLVDEPT